MRYFLFVLLCSPIIAIAQNNVFFGAGLISSFGETTFQETTFSVNNYSDFGVYYGNEFRVKNQFGLILEVCYLNNQLVLATSGNKKFELHQNIGLGIKPGFYIKDHSFHLNVGILGVYVFDKDVIHGNQLDHFDEAYYYGLDYYYDISPKISLNSGFLVSSFESISHYTNHTLKKFSVLKLSIYYHI